jgi:hypothetical protein
MNKLQSTRLDDRLNAVLIALGLAALMVLTIDTAREDQAQSSAAAQQATVTTPAAPANITAMVSGTAPAH